MADEYTWIKRQRLLNVFVKKHIKGVGRIFEDGDPGSLTKKRIKQCKYWLGWKERSGVWSDQLERALKHPMDWRVSSKGTVARGVHRRKKHNYHHYKSYLKAGVSTYDGVRVAACAVPILEWCRQNGWHGRLVSGYRDPRYSESLCYAMCGAPRCPGRCAGRSSNHSGNSPIRFAIDVSDYYSFGRVVRRCPLKPHIFNALGVRDPVHFSPSGN